MTRSSTRKKVLQLMLFSMILVGVIVSSYIGAYSQPDLQIISKENVDLLQRLTILGCDEAEIDLCDKTKGLFAENIAFSPAGNIVGALFIDNRIRLWWVEKDYTPLDFLEIYAYDLEFSPDERWLAVGGTDGVVLLDVPSFEEMLRFSEKCGRSRLAFEPAGGLLVSADSSVTLCDLSTGDLLNEFDRENKEWPEGWPVSAIAYSPNGQMIAVGRLGPGNINIWRVEQLDNPLFTLQLHSGPIRSLEFSPDSTLLASGSEDETVRLWNTSNGAEIGVLTAGNDYVFDVSFSPDGSLLAIASGNTVSIWDVERQDKLVVFVYPQRVYSVRFSPNGTILAIGGKETGIELWGID